MPKGIPNKVNAKKKSATMMNGKRKKKKAKTKKMTSAYRFANEVFVLMILLSVFRVERLEASRLIENTISVGKKDVVSQKGY